MNKKLYLSYFLFIFYLIFAVFGIMYFAWWTNWNIDLFLFMFIIVISWYVIIATTYLKYNINSINALLKFNKQRILNIAILRFMSILSVNSLIHLMIYFHYQMTGKIIFNLYGTTAAILAYSLGSLLIDLNIIKFFDTTIDEYSKLCYIYASTIVVTIVSLLLNLNIIWFMISFTIMYSLPENLSERISIILNLKTPINNYKLTKIVFGFLLFQFLFVWIISFEMVINFFK